MSIPTYGISSLSSIAALVRSFHGSSSEICTHLPIIPPVWFPIQEEVRFNSLRLVFKERIQDVKISPSCLHQQLYMDKGVSSIMSSQNENHKSELGALNTLKRVHRLGQIWQFYFSMSHLLQSLDENFYLTVIFRISLRRMAPMASRVITAKLKLNIFWSHMKALVCTAKISKGQAGSTSALEHWCAHSLWQSCKAKLT